MNETFLSYLWKYRQLNNDIATESGDQLAILHPGEQNTDSGPDFFNARLRIGETTWAGNVEIHVKSSDWQRHWHHTDPEYDHVILHVVFEDDRPVFHQNGEPMQTLVIRNRFPCRIYDRYRQMMQNQQWIPCMNQLGRTGDPGFNAWAPALAVERLEQKTGSIRQMFSACNNDWDEAVYRHMAGSFGFKINNLAFELLAKSLPLKIVRQSLDSVFRLESLLFGQAGMLGREFGDAYPGDLNREYQFLRDKYTLEPVPGSLWKFLRLRPSNFPTVRISQFAGFLHLTHARFFTMLEANSVREVTDALRISASEYWNTHYQFDKPAGYRQKAIGQAGVKLLTINGVIPFLFFYGCEKDQPAVCERALEYLEQLDGEENALISQWKTAGFPAENALQTQALIQLKKFYCDKKRCLECRIGSRLLGQADG